MEMPKALFANITHECGAKLQLNIDQANEPYHCPGCGLTDQLTDDSLSMVLAGSGVALMEASRRVEATGQDARVAFNCHTRAFEA